MKHFRLIFFLGLLAFFNNSNAQDDGPRVYWNAPSGTNVIEAYAWFSQSNSLYGNSTLFSPDITSNGMIVLFKYNHWSFRVGLPFIQKLDLGNLGKLTTLEITPSAWIFSSNKEFAGDLQLEQATFIC